MTKDEIRAAKKFLAQGRPTSPGCVAFMLRSCASDMSAYGGFVWPRSGEVSCPDWKPARECGNGLHGLLWGEGSVSLTAQDDPNANWLVCAVWTTDVVDLGDKVKVPRSFVVFTGSRFDAVAELQKLGARKSHWGIYSAGDSGTATAGDSGTATAGNRGTATAGSRGTATAGYAGTATAGHAGTATAGNRGTATAGDSGTATAGDSGTATAGNRGTATAGHAGTATAGDSGTATAGDSGTATAGYRGTATAGDSGTATAGNRGTATAGDAGTATAGYAGTATAGYAGTATAGDSGTATAGEYGMLVIMRWNGKRYRAEFAHVGENGILPNTKYKLDEQGQFVRAT
jgi:hypothetical protein